MKSVNLNVNIDIVEIAIFVLVILKALGKFTGAWSYIYFLIGVKILFLIFAYFIKKSVDN